VVVKVRHQVASLVQETVSTQEVLKQEQEVKAAIS